MSIKSIALMSVLKIFPNAHSRYIFFSPPKQLPQSSVGGPAGGGLLLTGDPEGALRPTVAHTLQSRPLVPWPWPLCANPRVEGFRSQTSCSFCSGSISIIFYHYFYPGFFSFLFFLYENSHFAFHVHSGSLRSPDPADRK